MPKPPGVNPAWRMTHTERREFVGLIMIKNIYWAVFVIVAALLQMTWVEKLAIWDVRPNLALLFVIYFAVADGEERAMFTGVLAGILQDTVGDNSLGHHVLCYVLIGYGIGRLATRLVTDHPAVKAVLVFISALTFGILYNTIAYVQNPAVSVIRNLTSMVIPTAFYTAIATPLVFYVLERVFHPEDLRR